MVKYKLGSHKSWYVPRAGWTLPSALQKKKPSAVENGSLTVKKVAVKTVVKTNIHSGCQAL